MKDVNELSNEVANFASRLGFDVDGEQPSSERKHEKVARFRQQKSNRQPAQRNRKSDLKKGIRFSKGQKKDRKRGDHYDKAALLRILSGPEEASTVDLKRLKKAKSILSESSPLLWHAALEELPELENMSKKKCELDERGIQQRKQQAEELCCNEKDAYEYRMHTSKKQGKWLLQVNYFFSDVMAKFDDQVREKGTHSDKIAALSLQIRDAVVANVSEIDPLLNMAEKQKGSKELVVKSLKAVTELFRCYLLPDRKLIFFEERPLQLLKEDHDSKLRLLYWFVEDNIKRKFALLTTILEAATLAPLDYLRSESVTLVSTLLYEKPEQEAQLLRMLIHKLGDRTKRTGSKVAHLISKLLTKHPRMKLVVLREAEKFVFLPGTITQSIHRVLQVFNDISYEHNETDKLTATRFIRLCLSLFQLLVDGAIGSKVDLNHKEEMKALVTGTKRKKRERKQPTKKKRVKEVDASIFCSLIAGIRRSLLFSDKSELGQLMEQHLDALFRMIHIAPTGVGIQILALLFQISSFAQKSITDRLYRAMYEKILDPQLSGTRRLPLFMSTLFKMMKEDSALTRVSAFAKRMLQIAQSADPHIYCAFLLLVAELLKFKPGLKNAVIQGENERKDSKEEYRIDSREPKHCGAFQACLWELCLALYHYHPVAYSMGVSLLSNQSVEARGDPFQELSLSTFLEKFVTGVDVKSKVKAFGGIGRTTPGASISRSALYSADLFSSLASQDVPVEDAFFHKYFSLEGVKNAKDKRQRVKDKKRNVRKDKESSENDDDDDLQSLEESDSDGMNLDDEDIDDMFKNDKREKVSNKIKSNSAKELYDYEDLMQRMNSSDSDDLDENENGVQDDSVESTSEDEDVFSDGVSGDEINLPTTEFPYLLSSSEADDSEAPPKKHLIATMKKSDFADTLDSD